MKYVSPNVNKHDPCHGIYNLFVCLQSNTFWGEIFGQFFRESKISDLQADPRMRECVYVCVYINIAC